MPFGMAGVGYFLAVMGDIHFFGFHFWRLQQKEHRQKIRLILLLKAGPDNDSAIQQKSVYTLYSSLQFGRYHSNCNIYFDVH